MNKNYIMGKKIREARDKKGLNQKEFAEKLNVSQASVSKYESGENIPRMNRLKQIASILEQPLHYFLEETPGREEDGSQKRKKEIMNVIQEFWDGLGIDGKREAILDEPLIRFCISRIQSGFYDTKKQVQIIKLLKLIEEITNVAYDGYSV